MTSLLLRVRQFVQGIPQRIWFLPSLLTLGFLLLSLVIIRLRYTELIQVIDEQLSFLALSSVDTARSILSTLTGGLISLVVFSFSMVMVVLNQATSQFSPRLLPGLISKRQHQFILGFYLGTIIYNLSVLARIGPSTLERSVPIVAVLLAILFGVFSLILFIVFIDTISSSVRIDTIFTDLHRSTMESMANAQELSEASDDSTAPPDESAGWPVIESKASGYFLGLEERALLNFCEKHEINLLVVPYQGAFVHEGVALAKVPKTLNEEEIKALRAHFRISASEDIQSDYLQGMHQMTEIAVKAMSPGINDPVTAISAIDYLSSLLKTFLQHKEEYCLVSEKEKARVWLRPRPLSQVLFNIFAPLRTYCTADVMVTRRIIRTLQQLQSTEDITSKRVDLLKTEIQKVKSDAKERILNAADRKLIAEL